MLDTVKAKPLDLRRVNAKACRNWRTCHAHLVDLHGRVLAGVLQELNPEAAKRRADGRERPRRLEQFKLIDEQTGAWRNVGTGHEGDDLISLVQFLADDCDRHTAGEWLDDLTSRIRIVENAA